MNDTTKRFKRNTSEIWPNHGVIEHYSREESLGPWIVVTIIACVILVALAAYLA